MTLRILPLIGSLLLAVLACNLAAPSTPPSDLSATLAALTPQSAPPDAFPTLTFAAASSDGPAGKIVLTCQIFKVQASNQICIMNADGTGYRRLTTDNTRQHYYPSLSPDGASVTYAAFREANVYEIYEMNLGDGSVRQLTDRLGILNSPEISPDGAEVVFMHSFPTGERYELWLMNRDGSNPHRLFDGIGWDPSWSPDGRQILFASSMSGSNQLHIVNADGTGVTRVSNLPALRGRSDWSPQNQVVTYSGGPWAREVFAMNLDGSSQHQISPPGGNSQGPSFSPDGQWVAFTAYFDKFDDIHGCEIYIMRTDGTDLRRLTDNDYCDYQPRWGF
jgi:TolB protein